MALKRKPTVVKWEYVDSSAISAVGYDPATQVLHVMFKRSDNPIYSYPDVSVKTFRELLGAESVGRFFNQAIKPKEGGK